MTDEEFIRLLKIQKNKKDFVSRKSHKRLIFIFMATILGGDLRSRLFMSETERDTIAAAAAAAAAEAAADGQTGKTLSRLAEI